MVVMMMFIIVIIVRIRGTGVRGLMRGMATLPKVTRKY